MASLFIAYVLWFFAGWTGLHLFYVGRDEQYFMYLTTFGGFFFGWILDGWKLPNYVQQSSAIVKGELEIHKIRMKTDLKPSYFQIIRFVGSLCVAGLYGYITSSVVDATSFSSNESVHEIIYNGLYMLGASFGVYLVGNFGMHSGSFKEALKGAFVGTILNWFYRDPEPDPESLNGGFVLLCSFIMFSRSRKWTTIEEHFNRRGNGGPERVGTCKRFWRVMGALFIFYSMCFSGLYFHFETTDKETGETTRLRDSIDNLIRSPIWGDLYSSISDAYYSEATWESFFDAMSEGVDLDGENSARKTLGVSSDATWKEIKSAHRRLARELHPDKGGDQTKFMEMQDAFERLKKKEDSRKRRVERKEKRKNSHNHDNNDGGSSTKRSNADAAAAEREAEDEANALAKEDAEKLKQANQKSKLEEQKLKRQSEQRIKSSRINAKKGKIRKKKSKKRESPSDL